MLRASWFKMDTPLGSYHRDWAVAAAVDGREQLYFVAETKGDRCLDVVRPTEQAKIFCGRKHSDAFGRLDSRVHLLRVVRYLPVSYVIRVSQSVIALHLSSLPVTPAVRTACIRVSPGCICLSVRLTRDAA